MVMAVAGQNREQSAVFHLVIDVIMYLREVQPVRVVGLLLLCIGFLVVLVLF